VFALCIFVMTLFPILLGFSEEAAWSLPWLVVSAAPGRVASLIAILLIATLVLAFIPIVGRINSIYTTIIGGIVLIILIGIIAKENPNFEVRHLRLWPGLWFSTGLIVVGAFLGWLGAMFVTGVGVLIDTKFEGMGVIVATPIAATFGF
jgi:uncharacterized integral membrane protein